MNSSMLIALSGSTATFVRNDEIAARMMQDAIRDGTVRVEKPAGQKGAENAAANGAGKQINAKDAAGRGAASETRGTEKKAVGLSAEKSKPAGQPVVYRSAEADALRDKVADMSRALQSLRAAAEQMEDVRVTILQGDSVTALNVAAKVLHDVKLEAAQNAVTVTAEDVDRFVGSEAGDAISIDAEAVSRVAGEAGDDAIGIEAVTVNRVTGGRGDDAIAVNAARVKGVHGGAGNDSIAVAGEAVRHVRGGNGDDEMSVRGYRVHGVNGGNGDDRIAVTATHASGIAAGGGNDTVVVNAAKVGRVDAGGGNDLVSVTAESAEMIDLGEGNDVFDLNIGDARMSLNHGFGNDIVSVADGNHLRFVVENPRMMMDGATRAVWEDDALVMTFGTGESLRIENAANAGSISLSAGGNVLTLMARDDATASGLFDFKV